MLEIRSLVILSSPRNGRRLRGGLSLALLGVLAFLPNLPAQAQTADPTDAPPALETQDAGAPASGQAGEPGDGATARAPERYRSPYQAFQSEAFDQALEGFVDQQVERPDDPELLLNIGAAHYKMKNYEDAESAFQRVAMAGDEALRAEALYNLGNTSFRQGRLEEAVERYRKALEVNPDDQDTKFNLEFVLDEIRRRHEEAKKRQEEQQQQQQDQPQDQQQQQDQGQEGQQQQQQQSQDQLGDDQDQDGLPDQVENAGENPTDPQDADSDDDGLEDGQEDANRNGRLDEGETDPNNPDSDGDGKSDGQEAQEQEQQAGGEGQAAEAQPEEGLTPEEAARYLQALEEGRPQHKRPPRDGRPSRPAKDW